LLSEYLPTHLDGDSWENICQDCYRLRYQSEHYQKIEATHDGDTGIEGFTKSGVVFQSYCPEREYDAQMLYEHLRDKVTKDIGKLIKEKNIKKQKQLGVSTIKEWHFVTPKCSDSRLLNHLQRQRKRVLEFKEACEQSDDKDKKELCNHIHEDFDVILKIADDFKPELYSLARNRYLDLGFDFSRDHSRVIDFSTCESEKVKNVTRKIKAIMNSEEEIRTGRMVNFYMSSYLSGIEILETLRENFPEIHIDLIKLRDSYKNKAMSKTNMNPSSSANYSVFQTVVDEFENQIKNEFENVITTSSIAEICQDIIAGWLADCTMEFVRYNNAKS
jgi:hypothetical protein